jgi:hypothetical protein
MQTHVDSISLLSFLQNKEGRLTERYSSDIICVSVCIDESDFMHFLKEYQNGPPLWSTGHSSRLQIQRSEFDSGRY